jgi:hypothetical protein
VKHVPTRIALDELSTRLGQPLPERVRHFSGEVQREHDELVTRAYDALVVHRHVLRRARGSATKYLAEDGSYMLVATRSDGAKALRLFLPHGDIRGRAEHRLVEATDTRWVSDRSSSGDRVGRIETITDVDGGTGVMRAAFLADNNGTDRVYKFKERQTLLPGLSRTGPLSTDTLPVTSAWNRFWGNPPDVINVPGPYATLTKSSSRRLRITYDIGPTWP